MKQKTTLTRSRWLFACLLSLLMTLGGASPAWGDELTINNGSATSSKVPIEGLNADSQKRSEFIIPANMLDNLTGGTITKISFNLSSPPDAAWTATFKVFVKEVVQSQYTNTGSYYSPSASFVGDTETTTVYTGTLDATSGTMDVSFNSGYVYGGGNLLVGFYITEAGNWKSATFTGATSDSYSSCTGSMSTASGTPEKFLPKITFTYTPDPNYIAKPSNVTASNITATTATISWNAVDGADSYELSCSTNSAVPDAEGSYTSVNTSSYNLTGLLAENVYYVYVRTIKGDKHSAWSTVCSFEPTAAVTAIVNDGSATNGYVPIYGLYADIKNTQSQFIIPASSLEDISGGTIKKLSFHTNGAYNFGNAATKVYLKEVNYTSLSSNTPDFTGMTEVYDGAISVVDNQMLISFDTPFTYNDGNLMIAFQQTENGGGSSISWLGISGSNNPATGGYSGNFSYYQFLPKMTITYLPSNNPKMSVVSEGSYDFGFLTSASENAEKTASFTVKNIGAAALTDANVSYTGDAAIAVLPNGALESIDAKGSTEISITVDTETPDTYAGTITVTGTGSDNVVIPVKAIVRNTDKLFVDFDENNPKPAAWTLGSGWSVNSTNSIATIGNTTAAITTSEILSAGETLTLRYRGNYDGDGASLAVSYSTTTVDGDYTDAVETVSSIGYNVWKYATFTIPATAKFVKVTGKYIDLDAFYGLQAPAVPVVVLSTTSHNFGLVSNADTQALTLTISNEGGAALTGLSVTPTSGFAVTDMEGNALATTTIAAGSSLNVKVKMNAVGQQNGTVTISGTGVDAQEVTVSGYMLDNTKICETFASASSVSRWTVASGWTFNASTGAYSGTSERTMTTPKISVGEGNVLALNVKLGWSGGSLKVEGSTDNGTTWEAFEAKVYNSSNGGLNTSSYVLLTINDIPTTVNKIRLTGYYAYINVFNGFTYVNDPQVGFFSNEACTSVQASPATKNFGFATEAQNQTYYVKNTGNGQVDLTIDAPSGFTAIVNDGGEALTENEVATLTITMPATEGLHDGTITVTAKNHDDDSVLGTFLVNANGGITGTKNNVVLTAFPAGWKNNNWAIYSGAARIWSSTPSDLITTTLRVAAGDKLLVDAKKYDNSDDSQLSYSYSANNGTSWSDPVSLTSSLGTDYKIVAISGIPEGDVLMKFTGTYAYIRQIYGFEAVAEPIMEFAANGTTKSFGMITAKATSDAYTITNSGTALLDNLSVTCDNDNFEIAVADDANSIAAGGNVTFTVALKTTALGSQSGTVTISGTGVESKTLNVKGYVADDSKIFETFSSSLPARWENTSVASWTISNNAAYAGNYVYSGGYKYATLESPKIIVAEGQKLAISAKLSSNSSSYYVKVEGSTNNGSTWDAFETKTFTNDVLTNTDYTVIEIDDIPTTVNKIRLIGYYVYVNGLNGFTYDENDPEFSLFSDEECNIPIATATVTNAWGFVNEDKTATYYIKNTGTGTLNLSKTDAPTGFTATLGATSLGTGEKTSLTIAMANNSATNEGYHAGNVVLTAMDNADNTLGTFTVTSSGVVVGSKTDVNFTALDAFPAGWETTTWSVTANTKATVGYSQGTLTTGTYTVAAGEKLVVKTKKNSNSGTLSYKVSTDGGANFGASTTITPSSTSEYELKVIDGIAAGSNVKIEFTGYYVDIERIYGYTAKLEPVMTLSPAAANYDFGMQTDAAEYVITVTNSGTADMTGVTAELAGTDAADYQVAMSIPDGSSATISENVATIPVGQTLKVTATLKASTEYKEHNATLTISADGLADKVITLKGKTRDASKLYADFQDDLPATWIADGWSRTYSGTNYFVQANASGTNTLTTPALTVAAGEELKYDAWFGYSAGSITVRYTTNNGITWTEQNVECSTTQTTKTLSLGNASPVTAYIQFVGNSYARIDNFYGGSPAVDVPLISVTKSGNAVESGATEAFGSINAEATATYTITNVGNGTLTITDPVTKTGAATVTVNKTSLANGESATLIITMPVEAPYEYKEGVVTVVTNLGNFVINYNATILNPNALDEQFASGKPTGWYFGGYWEIESQTAQNSASGIADLITEQLTVAGPSDELTFKAAKTGSSAETFRVYTSQDRVTWDAVDLGELTLTTSYQDVNISGLAAGDYYVKITGARVKVDNFLGWTKKNNTRDLYITATSFPATTTKGNNATITATVTSLIAAETGVYAKLFINGVQEGDASASQDIALNGTKTFSFTYAIPENKTAQIKVYYSNDTEAFATAVNTMKVNYALSETPSEAITTGTFNVTLNRTFVDGWNTICLPFAVSAENMKAEYGENVALYELTSFTDGNLKFTKLGEEIGIAAGKPYLIYVEGAITESKSFVDAVISETTPTDIAMVGVTFHGTFAPIAAGGLTDKYGISSDGRIAKANSATYINGFRGYLEGELSSARISVYDETTGITRVYGADEIFGKDDKVYDLNGRRVENAKKGLYIVNGRKVVVK